LPLQVSQGRRFSLLQHVQHLHRPGEAGAWPAITGPGNSSNAAEGRVCAIRKSDAAIAMAGKKLRNRAMSKGRTLKPETLEFAKCMIAFTTFPAAQFPAEQVLQWHRIRWQAELVFKRFKSIAQPSHLPKYSPESSRAWLYGKLLAALLTERLIRHAVAISPWGHELRLVQCPGQAEGIPVHVPSGLSSC